MAQTTGTKVPFDRKTAKKCICWKCPVQEDSQCIKENSEKLGEVMTSKFFEPQIVPGLYCSSGVASCKDIKTERPCICGDCEVYQIFSLGSGQPLGHFCKNGNAR